MKYTIILNNNIRKFYPEFPKNLKVDIKLILCYNVIYRFPNNLFLQSYESFSYEIVELAFSLHIKFWIESMSSLLLDHFLITFYSIDFADENEEEDEEQEEEMELEEEEEEDEEYNTEYIEVNRIFNIKTIENFFIGF